MTHDNEQCRHCAELAIANKLQAELIQMLGDALFKTEQYMTSVTPTVGPGCVCHCPVIDGHSGACQVFHALDAFKAAGFTPTEG